MKLEIWSDFACPFCLIGKKRLEAALEGFHAGKQVEVTYKSYQLDPNSPKYNGENYYESLAKKFGSIEQAKQMTANIQEQAKTVGLAFDFENGKPTNTLDAHRLNKLAEQEQAQEKLSELLFQAHFIEGKDIGDRETLKQIANDANMDETKTLELLDDSTVLYEAVQKDIQEAAQFGISGVPFFIINRKYAISGAQPVAAFSQALEQVWQEENKQSSLQHLATNDESGDACGIDGCDVSEENA